MSYYDDGDEYYNGYYDYDDCTEPVSFIGEEFSERVLTDVIMSAGLTPEKIPRFEGSMERLVFMYGEDSEVYSPAEIKFIERIENVLVYPDYIKKLNHGVMVCRTIVAKLNYMGHDALRACVSFEKIINKALDGFNIFFFVTDDAAYFGCRAYDKKGKRDCALSNPISEENRLDQIVDELSFLVGIDSFQEYYGHIQLLITEGQSQNEDYEQLIILRRGIQLSYLDNIEKVERDTGINMSKEKERYWNTFYEEPEESFAALLEEAEESLAFIKSNRVNTYEMLFEADEMMRQADEIEAENEKLVSRFIDKRNDSEESEYDKEAKALIDDPEEMIKLLKKRRGI